MRYFSVTEALQYLNELLPDVAPKNEETIRRAIRSGKLKADQRLGRGGNRISESDLIAFSKSYAAKSTKQNQRFGFANVLPQSIVMDADSSITEIMRNYLESENEDHVRLKLELLEARKKWERHRSNLRVKLINIENEIEQCDTEIHLIDAELKTIEEM